jgi:hypothetical protein
MGIFHFKDHCAIYKLGYQKHVIFAPLKAFWLENPLEVLQEERDSRYTHVYLDS